MNNRRYKEIILDFIELTTDLKTRRINPGFHFMENEESTDLKMTITTMNIKYQLVPPINHRVNNSKRSIDTFKNHFIAGLCSLYKYSQLQFWDRLIQQEIISLNILSKSRVYPHISAYMHIFG